MKKKMIGTLFLIVIMISMTISTTLAYSDDLFEFDLPSSYVNLTYQGMYAFSDSNNEGRGFIIYTEKDTGMKKSVWEIDQIDLDRLIRTLSRKANVISTDKRAKLGKEKAVKVILSDGEDYIELYILASNKYIYMFTFLGKSETDLNNADYTKIKDSFKLKDATTNFRLLYIILILIVIAISGYVKYRKSSCYPNYSKKQSTIDYKNLTEDDFKRM